MQNRNKGPRGTVETTTKIFSELPWIEHPGKPDWPAVTGALLQPFFSHLWPSTRGLLHSPLVLCSPSALWAYPLSVLLYSGEFLGFCRHDPERRLQFSSVNLLTFFPGQHSTSTPRFLDCLALLLNCLRSGPDSWEVFPAWYSIVITHVLCMQACHKRPSEAGAKTRETPGCSECMCWGDNRRWNSKGWHIHQLPLWSRKSGCSP
jgi:hypothetical protein